MDKIKWRIKAAQASKLKPSNTLAFVHICSDLTITVTAISLSCQKTFSFWLIGQIVLFVSIWRWFGILHTCTHGVFFVHRRWNRWAGKLSSIFALVPFESWRESHLAHHHWTGWKEMDPSLSFAKSCNISSRTKKILDFCWKYYIPIFPVLLTFVKASVKQVGEKDKGGFSIILIAHLVFLVFLKSLYFKVFLIPIVSYLVASDLVIVSQHNVIDTEWPRGQPKPIPYYEQDRFTKTLHYPRWISRFVLLFFDKHGVHHLYPHVPHYRLSTLGDCGLHEENWINWLRRVKSIPGHRVYLE